MITYSSFKSFVLTNGRRVLKVVQFGAKTADECAPFGDDGCPLPNMTAIYAETSEVGEQVIIGYINTKQLAAIGEKRIYSLTADGTLSFYAWLRNNGTMELGGTADNIVRYTPLAEGLEAQNEKLNAELVKIAAAIGALGGSYAIAPVTVDVTGSKVDEIKCL